MYRSAALFVLILAVAVGGADPAPKGQRIYTTGHSFHVFVPGILTELAKSAGIADHKQVGTSSIGGSRVIQHWDVKDDKFKSKQMLKEGKVDVLTMSPIYLPDDGIDNFVALAVENNPNVRVTVQEFWLPFDVFDPNYQKSKPKKVDRNSRTVADMKKEHAEYFTMMDNAVKLLNEKHKKSAVFVVPVGQAAILLREKIIDGKAPGLKQQEDLFSDAIGHAKAPLMALAAYCHFAVIYKQSPVGLPMPTVMKNAKLGDDGEKLNALLQELAWEAVTSHPLSGVKAKAAP